MKRTILSTALILLYNSFLFAQEDSSFFREKEMNEIVITATRTERKLSNVAVPVQLISNKTIQQSGSVRLNDILQEQTGLYLTSGGATSSAGGGVFGNGVQIQGLSPDYTLILVDGEPIIGRQGGVIDLTRITVGNIRKVEIVKGPSSSLYGSEAMGGVINIITDQPKHNQLLTSLRYGRFNALDANLTASLHHEKWALQVFGNRNSSQGFDFDKDIYGKTVDPFQNYTTQLRFNYKPTASTKISLSGRYFNEIQTNRFATSDLNTGQEVHIDGDGRIRDMNINPVLTQRFSDKVNSSLRFYFSRYEYEQNLVRQTDKTGYYYDFFQQDFYRAENQTDIRLQANNYLSIGGGLVQEKLNTTRYSVKRANDIQYVFLQDEWRVLDNLTLIGGLRYDANSAYQSRMSPKLALHWKVNDKLTVNSSYGAGFKAPDFRQLFLNFLNTAAGGYVVYGANEITISTLEEQQQQGVIKEILPRAYQLALLKPEISKGFNTGIKYEFNDRLNLALNLFRNDIENLIQNDIIAYRANNAPVYSYFNVSRAYTEGAELQGQYQLTGKIQLQGGYQYLITADKDDLKRIKAGTVYTRNEQTGYSTTLLRKDYAGLPNRSKHMANLKLFYYNDKKGWSGSVRTLYRSRWGTYDKEGNGVINRSDEFAKGFLQFNIAATKEIRSFRFQVGVDNLLNYRDPSNLPGMPGIQPYLSVSYSIPKNKNQ
ncbi:MAG: TonB-dependent receptor [Terrimonas sp.]|nr:TonB-dependent receptor [Terrimonas sp.]